MYRKNTIIILQSTAWIDYNIILDGTGLKHKITLNRNLTNFNDMFWIYKKIDK